MKSPQRHPPTATQTQGPSHAEPALRTVESRALLGELGVLYIRHHGELYRLQATRLGKLILTK